MDLRKEQIIRLLTNVAVDSGIQPKQVNNTVKLLLEGGTVPFIARYRKEQTGELDEVQIRLIEERYQYHSDLEDRKNTILSTIEEQGKLTEELRDKIENTAVRAELEDFYLPYKPKRRTKATIARERGLEPLAEIISAQDVISGTPDAFAIPFVIPDGDVPDAAAAIQGASYIIAEQLSDSASVRELCRTLTREKGVFSSRLDPSVTDTVTKYEMYYEYREPLHEIPSHRMLAMRRGMDEEVLLLSIDTPEEEIIGGLKDMLITRPSIFQEVLEAVAFDAYHRLIGPSIELELFSDLKKQADEVAIKVFAENLKNLLMLPPAGSKRVLGIDPGLRTGSKCAVVDQTGRFIEHLTIYPHTGARNVAPARSDLTRLATEHSVELIAIGNGTAGREMEQFARETLKEAKLEIPVVAVNESGASIYSASDIAREEFPNLDLTVRGAISIARRLQDPLAELVKIDPKSIGVGQYQHDVNQAFLQTALDHVVESCVNFVGVELNTASYSLMAYVSGIGPSLAKAIVTFRDTKGAFTSRGELMEVPRFGAKAFEQCAGFLRIRNAAHPLDNTSVHPERYALVEQMAADIGTTVDKLVADRSLVEKIKLTNYVSEDVGMPTLKDIIAELIKPGRDPRDSFQMAEYREDVKEISDLETDMILQGTVTNVTNFGAFVDVGVHQDGLVHISHLSRTFVSDPALVVKVGQIVKVKVLEVDRERKRIALSIKEADEKPKEAAKPAPERKRDAKKKAKKPAKPKSASPFDALDSLGLK